MKDFTETLIKNIEKKFCYSSLNKKQYTNVFLENSKVHFLSLLLDLRFKLMFHDEFIHNNIWKEELKQEYITFVKQNKLNQSNNTDFKNIPRGNKRIGNKLLSYQTPNYTINTLFQNLQDQFKKINIVNTSDGIQYDFEEYINVSNKESVQKEESDIKQFNSVQDILSFSSERDIQITYVQEKYKNKFSINNIENLLIIQNSDQSFIQVQEDFELTEFSYFLMEFSLNENDYKYISNLYYIKLTKICYINSNQYGNIIFKHLKLYPELYEHIISQHTSERMQQTLQNKFQIISSQGFVKSKNQNNLQIQRSIEENFELSKLRVNLVQYNKKEQKSQKQDILSIQKVEQSSAFQFTPQETLSQISQRYKGFTQKNKKFQYLGCQSCQYHRNSYVFNSLIITIQQYFSFMNSLEQMNQIMNSQNWPYEKDKITLYLLHKKLQKKFDTTLLDKINKSRIIFINILLTMDQQLKSKILQNLISNYQSQFYVNVGYDTLNPSKGENFIFEIRNSSLWYSILFNNYYICQQSKNSFGNLQEVCLLNIQTGMQNTIAYFQDYQKNQQVQEKFTSIVIDIYNTIETDEDEQLLQAQNSLFQSLSLEDLLNCIDYLDDIFRIVLIQLMDQ
ncbi:hypothetical protein ABPG72_019869 [Tetrahymena utriculariae]